MNADAFEVSRARREEFDAILAVQFAKFEVRMIELAAICWVAAVVLLIVAVTAVRS